MCHHTITLLSLAAICIVSQWEARGAVVRSDDPQPLDAVVERLVQKVDSLQTKLATQEAEFRQRIGQLEARTVAFTGACKEGTVIQATSSDSIINFNVVLANVGSAYNSITGVFTAPYDGVYYFSLNVDVSADYEVMSLNKNNDIYFYADKDDTVTTHVSGSAVINLHAGDIISVRHVASDKGFVECGVDSTFSGFLIY